MSTHNDTFSVPLIHTNITHTLTHRRGLCCGCSLKWLTVTTYPGPLGWFHSNVPRAFEGGRNYGLCSLNELSVLGIFYLRNKHNCTHVQRVACLYVNKCKTCNVWLSWPVFIMICLRASHFQQCLILCMFMHVNIFVCGRVCAFFRLWSAAWKNKMSKQAVRDGAMKQTYNNPQNKDKCYDKRN